MKTKKKAIVLLQSNHVGSFDCDHTLLTLTHTTLVQTHKENP